MRTCWMVLAFTLIVSFTVAGVSAEIEGRGNTGLEIDGLACRITTDKTDYVIGETVRVLVEVTNNSKNMIALGLEPLIEIKHKSGSSFSRQPAELQLRISQGNPGFFATHHATFPKGLKSQARAVALKPKDKFSETVQVKPWGPTYGSIPSTAQTGTMTINGSLLQFLTPDLKMTQIQSNAVVISVKAGQDDVNK